MEKRYRLVGLDCPHCAGEIERDVEKLPAVKTAAINLIEQTLVVEADLPDDELLEAVTAIVRSHEPEVEVIPAEHRAIPTEHAARGQSHDHGHDHGDGDGAGEAIRLIVGGVIYLVGVVLLMTLGTAYLWLWMPALVIAYLVLGADVLWKAINGIIHGRVFDERFLMAVSTLAAFAVGEYAEAVAVMLLYQVGELFQGLAVDRSRRSVQALVDIRPDKATILKDGLETVVPAASVAVGDRVLVKAGERIPLDGVVREGGASLDMQALTGESMPRDVGVGDTVLSGAINRTGMLTVEVTVGYEQSTASRIVDMVENAASRKAPAERFITRFSRWYTPIVVGLAVLLSVLPPLLLGGGWTEWIHRGCVFLVISCPCALVISVPLAFFGGIGASSKHGVLVKGGNFLEALGRAETVVFDKTGTLTKGSFTVAAVQPAKGVDPDRLLYVAAAAERLSLHPIARSVVAAFGDMPHEAVTDYEERTGLGVRAVVRGKTVLVGNADLMKAEAIDYQPSDKIGTVLYVAEDGRFLGSLVVTDTVKEDSARTIKELKERGVKHCVMLTGDNEEIARETAKELGIPRFHAGLLPADKVEKVEQLENEAGGTLVFVGDGINDAPVLARADVGVAMGALGSDAAIEAADVVLMTDEPSKLLEGMAIAAATRRIVWQNIVVSLGVKLCFLVLGALGLVDMWAAVFADVGVMLIAVLNSMRMLKK
ncbi:MAG: cadmium-translocating P-type ATPase [Clostridia bacterium]|nr:cadmium-translocating P-type ATPase [Clostridia bacterium]